MEELKVIEDNGSDKADEADKAAWEKVLLEEVEAKFRDIDLRYLYPLKTTDSPIVVPSGRPLFPSTTPTSPATSEGGQASTLKEEGTNTLFTVEELFAEEELCF